MILEAFLLQLEIMIGLILFAMIIIGIIIRSRKAELKKRELKLKLQENFPEAWKEILRKKVIFYKELDDEDKSLFEKRIQLFISSKNIDGVGTEIDDSIKLMVASSAVIPSFAFPGYNYPSVSTILLYPNSFDEEFKTERYKGHKEFITGMVGDGAMNGTVILSKPELEKAFDGIPHKTNVGIHEFVHLLDKEDGAIDGIPKLLIEDTHIDPWLFEIKKEMRKMEKGNSDINPYGITNNAEFLAVVSEYFFDNPDKFKRRHPELYSFLSTFFYPDFNELEERT